MALLLSNSAPTKAAMKPRRKFGRPRWSTARKLLRFAVSVVFQVIRRLTEVVRSSLAINAFKSVSTIRRHFPSACLNVIEQYVNFMVSVFPLPFVPCGIRNGARGKSGFPMLCATRGLRRIATIFIHFISICRALCWLPLVLQHNFKPVQKGMLSSDTWFAATVVLTAVAMATFWVKTWRCTAFFCWLHNSYCETNRKFSGSRSPWASQRYPFYAH